MEVSAGVLGVGLLLVGVTLLFVEASVPGWGGPGALGVVSTVAGVLVLLEANTIIDLPRGIVVALCVAAAIFVPVATVLIARLRKVPVHVPASLVGQEGVAASDIDPTGVVQVRSEQHSAETESGRIAAGERIRVVGEDGFKLRVTRA